MTLSKTLSDTTLVLTIDRPEAKNAIDRALLARLSDELKTASNDEQIHAVVLASSSHDVFISGGDLKELAQLPMTPYGAQQVINYGQAMNMIENCAVPVIAAVSGKVIGGGCELMLMCDLITMEDTAEIYFAHAKMGLCPAWGGSTRLLERLGRSRASELLFSGRTLSASDALAWGLVNEVTPPRGALGAAMALADRMGKLPRSSLCNAKSSLLGVLAAQRSGAFEAEAKIFRRAWGGEAHQAAIKAFVERR